MIAASTLHRTRRALWGRLKRHLVSIGYATFAMLGRLIAEYGRAVAAAQRYAELVRSGSGASRQVGAASVPRAIFEEFYSSRQRPSRR